MALCLCLCVCVARGGRGMVFMLLLITHSNWWAKKWFLYADLLLTGYNSPINFDWEVLVEFSLLKYHASAPSIVCTNPKPVLPYSALSCLLWYSGHGIYRMTVFFSSMVIRDYIYEDKSDKIDKHVEKGGKNVWNLSLKHIYIWF